MTIREEKEEGLHLVYAVHETYSVKTTHGQTHSEPEWNSSLKLKTDIRHFLLAKIPDYMVPSEFIFLEEMPLTQSGKVDRKLLPDPEIQRIKLDQKSYVAPGSNTEKTLTELWKNVLKTDVVGIQDNFFEIGGNSLLTAYLASQIKMELGVDIPIVKLFQYPTVKSLATYIDQGSINTTVAVHYGITLT